MAATLSVGCRRGNRPTYELEAGALTGREAAGAAGVDLVACADVRRAALGVRAPVARVVDAVGQQCPCWTATESIALSPAPKMWLTFSVSAVSPGPTSRE
jgi:hypothetical protein